MNYSYIIVGGGLAGASAIEGIRAIDKQGSILLIGSEKHLPYHRPPLSKQLWTGKKKLADIFIKDKSYYEINDVSLDLGIQVTGVNAKDKKIFFGNGKEYGFQKLLLATGGKPRRLSIPGADLDEIDYFRTFDDYLNLKSRTTECKTALVIGGGFIGSEISAALTLQGIKATMIFPGEYPCSNIFPASLGLAIGNEFRRRGIRIVAHDKPQTIEKANNSYKISTGNREVIMADMVIAGLGIDPEIDVARDAGLRMENGVTVNELLETSIPGIYAAGDVAFFPYQALNKMARIEHWDNARAQGLQAGRNMAGAREPYTHMPYFFSDLFNFGYEAVGEIDARLMTKADWQLENDTGIVYYLDGNKVRGIMLCNIWDKVEDARRIIKSGRELSDELKREFVAINKRK
jgi:NADPH-dependent 2,4-dienoyl-CoA reductase/sulfur reductase-like enzyme